MDNLDYSEEVIHIEIYSELHDGSPIHAVDSDNSLRSGQKAGSISSVYEDLLLSIGDSILTWTCGECWRSFLTHKQIYHHINQDHLTPCVECFMCRTVFGDKTHLEDHLSVTHSVSQADLACPTCFQQFASASELEIHTSTHPNIFKCMSCSDLFPSYFHVRIHEISHKHSITGHECCICGCVLLNRNIYDAHILRHKQASCQMCTYSTQNHTVECLDEDLENMLLKHIKSTHSHDEILNFLQELKKQDEDEKNLDLCYENDHGFSKENNAELGSNLGKETEFSAGPIQTLQNHFPNSSLNKEVGLLSSAPLTEYNSGKASYFNSLAGSPSQPRIKPSVQSPPRCVEPAVQECKEPPLSSSQECPVYPGSFSDHSGNTFECPECHKKLKSKSDLLNHELDHLKPLTCDICSIKLTHHREFKKHLRGHGVQVKRKIIKYKCSQCDVHCSTLSGLRKHILVHTDLKAFLCDVCGRKFRRSRALDVHMQAMHKPVNFHKCTQCGSKTRSQASLLRHIQCVHGGVRRFICGFCGARCLQNQDLRRHLKLAHNSSFPPLPSIKKKTGDKIHVIPSEKSLSSSDPLFSIIGSIVREEQGKLLELKGTSPLVAGNKQPLVLLGDVAARAAPLKQANLPYDSTESRTSYTPPRSSQLVCSICQYSTNDISDLTNHIVEHGMKTLPSIDPLRTIPLPLAQVLLLCSLPTYTVSGLSNSVASVTSDVFSHQSCIVPPGSVLCNNVSNSIFSTHEYVGSTVTLSSLEDIPLVSEPIVSDVVGSAPVQNFILETYALSSLKVNELSEQSSTDKLQQGQCSISQGEGNIVLSVNDFSTGNTFTSGNELNVSILGADNTSNEKSKNNLNCGDNVAHDKTVQVVVSVKELREFLQKDIGSFGGSIQINIPPNTDQEKRNEVECKSSNQLDQQQAIEVLSLWDQDQEHEKPVQEALLSRLFNEENKDGEPTSIVTKSDGNAENTSTSCVLEVPEKVEFGCSSGTSGKLLGSCVSPEKNVGKSASHVSVQVTGSASALFNSSVRSEYYKTYSCPQCNRQLSTGYNLKRHLITHKLDRPFKCGECNKTFAYEFNLTTHLRTHTGERPYICEICHKSFRHRRELKDHINTHEGKKPYQCLECGLQFTRYRELVRHTIKHDSSRRLKCEFCQKTFSRMDYLKVHVKKFHGKASHSSKDEENSEPEALHPSQKLDAASKEPDCPEDCRPISNSEGLKNFYQVMDEHTIGGNLINVAYQAAKGGLQLICVRDSDTACSEGGETENTNGNIINNNIMYLNLIESNSGMS